MENLTVTQLPAVTHKVLASIAETCEMLFSKSILNWENTPWQGNTSAGPGPFNCPNAAYFFC